VRVYYLPAEAAAVHAGMVGRSARDVNALDADCSHMGLPLMPTTRCVLAAAAKWKRPLKLALHHWVLIAARAARFRRHLLLQVLIQLLQRDDAVPVQIRRALQSVDKVVAENSVPSSGSSIDTSVGRDAVIMARPFERVSRSMNSSSMPAALVSFEENVRPPAAPLYQVSRNATTRSASIRPKIV
jgi:hypothetical protein